MEDLQSYLYDESKDVDSEIKININIFIFMP